jgi:hypothetical protein
MSAPSGSKNLVVSFPQLGYNTGIGAFTF